MFDSIRIEFKIWTRRTILRCHQYCWNVLNRYRIPYPFWRNPVEYDPRRLNEFKVAKRENNKLQKNMLLAQSALNYVKSLNIISPNLSENQNAKRDLIEMRITNKIKMRNTDNADEIIFADADISSICKVGNCGELADNAYKFLKHTLHKRKVDRCSISSGDHGFIVIGRQDNSNEDYRTWGPNVVVCDPWSNEIFPASEIENRLKSTNVFTREITTFDPRTQSVIFKEQNRIKLPNLNDFKNEIRNLEERSKKDGQQCILHLREVYAGKKEHLNVVKDLCILHKRESVFNELLKNIENYQDFKSQKPS